MYAELARVPVATPSRDSRYIPNVISAVPTMGKILWRPHRLIAMPDSVDVSSRPTISGSSCRPELVGLAPLTTCMYCGR